MYRSLCTMKLIQFGHPQRPLTKREDGITEPFGFCSVGLEPVKVKPVKVEPVKVKPVKVDRFSVEGFSLEPFKIGRFNLKG